MPISDNPVDYYHYYLASQRRVEQWVQETTRELQEVSLTVPIHHETDEFQTVIESAPTTVTRTTTLTGTGSGESRKTTESPVPDESRSRSQPSSKKVTSSRDNDRLSRSKTQSSSRKSRSSTSTKRGPAIYRYLPYCVIPILFAVAEPSIPTVAAAVMLLIGYMCMDYEIQNSRSKLSKPRTRTRTQSPSRSRRRRSVASPP